MHACIPTYIHTYKATIHATSLTNKVNKYSGPICSCCPSHHYSIHITKMKRVQIRKLAVAYQITGS